MSNAVLASYLIGLREGLEAVLVVSILGAYLVKSDRRRLLPLVWAGVGAALALSIAFGVVLTYTERTLSFQGQELFEGVTSLLAVCFVSAMIFWMRRTARYLKRELTERLDQAIAVGSFAVVLMAFLAVGREGVETSLLWFAAAQGAAATSAPLVGITLGLLTAVVLGFGIYRAAVRVNLGKFFQWTGVLLVLVAAGILKYGVHDLQEAGYLPGSNTLAFDATGWWDPSAWYSALLTGMFNLTPAPTLLGMLAYVAYAVPMLIFFRWPQRSAPTGAPAAPPLDPVRARS